MSAVNNLLDKYRQTCALTSDSAVADRLGLTRQGVHQWRKGSAWPSEEHVVSMAKTISEPEERWLAAIAMDRAPQPVKKYWLRLLQAAAVAVVAVALPQGQNNTTATTPAPARSAAHNPGSMYIMSNKKMDNAYPTAAGALRLQ